MQAVWVGLTYGSIKALAICSGIVQYMCKYVHKILQAVNQMSLTTGCLKAF